MSVTWADSHPRQGARGWRALAAAVALAVALLASTSQPGADQPATSPDPMTYEGGN